MPGAWTAGVRTRPKAVRVIRERERRDKWQSVSSWMRIGAPYRCHSFVCGPHIVVRPPESREKDRANVLPLLLLLLPLYRCCDLLLLSFRATLYVWESDSPWILGDVLTAAWRAIVPSLYLPVAFFFSLPPPPLFSSLSSLTRILLHSTPPFEWPRLTSTLFLAPDGLLGPGI